MQILHDRDFKEVLKMNKNGDINKNTYYILSPYFLRACISISRASSGKYYLTKRDLKANNFIVLKEANITLKVPFKALFDSNDKIKPIVSLSFSSAIFCPRDLKGLCQLKDSNMSCYAKNGQKRASGLYINNGIPCINSYLNSCLVMACLKELYNSNNLLEAFSSFINKNYPIVRYNLKGDFKDFKDLYILSFLVNRAFKTTFYGYSARDDILEDNNGYSDYLRANNCYLNGSNKFYTNRFKVTYDLKEWLLSPYICLGACNKCKKCFNLKNKTILCLIHNKNSDILLNTFNNRLFLVKLFNSLDKTLNLSQEDFKVKKGLLDALNQVLSDKIEVDLSFNDFKEFKRWLNTLHYDIKDNIDFISDIDYLKSLGVA